MLRDDFYGVGGKPVLENINVIRLTVHLHERTGSSIHNL